MISSFSRLVTSLVFLASLAFPARAEPMKTTKESFSAEVTKSVSYPFLLSLPTAASTDASKKWPLIIFLHGVGEWGTDLKLATKHGPPKLVAKGKEFDFIVASPQCPSGKVWSSDAIAALTDKLIKEYPVDADRIILTGVSMGGFGTWETGIEFPEKFAAIVPICGGGGVRWLIAGKLKNVPVWAFHGAKDPVVPLEYSQKMVDAVNKSGGNAKLTIYPEASHDSWTQAYETEELFKWMLEQKRKK